MVNNFLLCVSFHFVLCRGLQRIVRKITQSQAFGFKDEGQEGNLAGWISNGEGVGTVSLRLREDDCLPRSGRGLYKQHSRRGRVRTHSHSWTPR